MIRFPVKFLAVIAAIGLLATACAPAQATQPVQTQPTQALAGATQAQSNATQAQPAAATMAPTTAAAATSQVPLTGAAASSGGITFTLVAGKSTASYKVREQLASRSLPSDAIGTTQSISGTIQILPDGSINQGSSKFTVDLTTLQTDAQMRDNFVRRNVLQTSQYPTADFVAKQATGLPNPLPTSGQVAFKLIGDMTIHGTTKSITWDVTGNVNGNTATGDATTSFTFEDFGLNQPHISVVLSLVDNITLEVKGDIQRATN